MKHTDKGSSYSIYAVRNKRNGKMYIGMSSDIESRIRAHFVDLRRGGGCCQAMREDAKNGSITDWEFYCLESKLTKQEARERESYYIAYYETRNPAKGYNQKHPAAIPVIDIRQEMPPAL